MKYRNAVKKSFSSAAHEYEARADFQQEVAEELLGFIRSATPIKGNGGVIKILDTGCGTGRLMRELMGNATHTYLYGLDIALPMLIEAVESLGGRGVDKGRNGVKMGASGGEMGAGLINGACEALPVVSAHFDLVVSNLAYQWVSDLAAAFAEVERVLAPGGSFVFSTLGPKTLNELRSSLSEADLAAGGGRFSFTPFTDESVIAEALELSGLQLINIHRKTLVRSYDTPLRLLFTLKQTGASMRGRILERSLFMGTFLRSVGRIYEKNFAYVEGGVPATYEVFFVTAKKKH